jgi:hypothetical protein
VREPLEHIQLTGTDMGADNVLGRRIDQIPVVDVPRVREIGVVHRLLLGTLATLIDPNQEEKPKEPFLVPPGPQQHDGVVRRQRPVRASETAKHRYANPEKPVALAVLPRARLEKTLEVDSVVGIRFRAQLAAQRT